MIRVQTFPCSLAKAEADAFNRESGRIYTNVLVWHYRIYRRTGHWLSAYAAKRLEDYLGGDTILHATAATPRKRASTTLVESHVRSSGWVWRCAIRIGARATARPPGRTLAFGCGTA